MESVVSTKFTKGEQQNFITLSCRFSQFDNLLDCENVRIDSGVKSHGYCCIHNFVVWLVCNRNVVAICGSGACVHAYAGFCIIVWTNNAYTKSVCSRGHARKLGRLHRPIHTLPVCYSAAVGDKTTRKNRLGRPTSYTLLAKSAVYGFAHPPT